MEGEKIHTYFEMELFINKICNKGPSSLESSTSSPLKKAQN